MVGKYKTENNKLTEKYKVLFCHALSNNKMHKIQLDKNHLDILTLFVNSVVLLDVAFYFWFSVNSKFETGEKAI